MPDDELTTDVTDADPAPTPGGGAGGDCVCPKCGYETAHKIGVACVNTTCPKCGAKMQRKESASQDYDIDDLREGLENAETAEEAEAILFTVLEMEDNSLLTAAEAKLHDLKTDGREEIQDSFIGEIKGFHRTEDGTVEFTAIVAQCDVVNKNERLYPRSEFEANLKRVNRAAKAGRFKGSDGHPGFFSGSKPSEVCVKWERAFVQDNDVYLEGTLIPTSVGVDIGTAWEHGIAPEFSILGYGDSEVVAEKGKKEYSKITNYIWDRTDIVDTGAAKTKVVKYSHDAEETHEEVSIMPEEVDITEVKEELTPQPEQTTAPVVEPKVEPKVEAPKAEEKPELDIEALMDTVREKAEKAAQEGITAANEKNAVEQAKKAAIEKLAEGDKHIATIVGKAVNRATSIEEILQAIEEMAPAAAELRKPKVLQQFGIITGKEKQMAEFWNPYAGQQTDRPETEQGVIDGLLHGLEDNGKDNPSNPRWTFEKMLDTYREIHPEYLRACTKEGFLRDQTTTTSLGTTLPQVLPLIRSIMPKLIPYEIATVFPIDRPDARVPFFDMRYASGTYSGSDFDDSGAFDSDWPQHVEAADKEQESFQFTHVDLSAEEYSIYYKVTSIVIQDMQNIYNMDAEQELLDGASEMIALTINRRFLNTIRVGATAATNTYGTTMPTSWDSWEKWAKEGLAMWINYTSNAIGQNVYQAATWLVCGRDIAWRLGMMTEKDVTNVGTDTFGMGLKKTGVYANLYDVYVADWFQANTILMGFKPPNWKFTGSIYAPYIPLYVSPMDYDAVKNIAKRSANSRVAMRVINGNAFATLAIADEQGVNPT